MDVKELTYKEALRQALKEEMTTDESVILLGEDIGEYGGACGITLGLIEEFGKERVMDTPASESAIVGCGIGAAMAGMRPVCELASMDQAAMAFGELLNGASRSFYLSGGTVKVPMVIMIPSGFGKGVSQNGQSLESIFAQIPGLKVIAPSTPAQAKGMLKAAIRDDNPVILLENRSLMNMKGPVPETDSYILRLGKSYIEREGKDLTLVSWGASLVNAIEAADYLADENIDVAVINPMTLRPMFMDQIFDSVKETGRLLIVHDGNKTGGIGAEISARVAEGDCFDYLEAPIARLGGLDVPIPYNRNLESVITPQKEDIIQVVYSVLGLN